MSSFAVAGCETVGGSISFTSSAEIVEDSSISLRFEKVLLPTYAPAQRRATDTAPTVSVFLGTDWFLRIREGWENYVEAKVLLGIGDRLMALQHFLETDVIVRNMFDQSPQLRFYRFLFSFPVSVPTNNLSNVYNHKYPISCNSFQFLVIYSAWFLFRSSRMVFSMLFR